MMSNSESRKRIEELIEASSLGTDEAKAARATVSDEQAARVVARAKQLDSQQTITVKVTVDTDELREWAGKHADSGHHGVAHVLYKAASDGESLTDQAIREAVEQARAEVNAGWAAAVEALADEWESRPPCQTTDYLHDLRALLTADHTAALDAVKAEAAREAGERIAQAIEAERDGTTAGIPNHSWSQGGYLSQAARIARDVGGAE